MTGPRSAPKQDFLEYMPVHWAAALEHDWDCFGLEIGAPSRTPSFASASIVDRETVVPNRSRNQFSVAARSPSGLERAVVKAETFAQCPTLVRGVQVLSKRTCRPRPGSQRTVGRAPCSMTLPLDRPSSAASSRSIDTRVKAMWSRAQRSTTPPTIEAASSTSWFMSGSGSDLASLDELADRLDELGCVGHICCTAWPRATVRIDVTGPPEKFRRGAPLLRASVRDVGDDRRLDQKDTRFVLSAQRQRHWTRKGG